MANNDGMHEFLRYIGRFTNNDGLLNVLDKIKLEYDDFGGSYINGDKCSMYFMVINNHGTKVNENLHYTSNQSGVYFASLQDIIQNLSPQEKNKMA